MSKPTVSKPRDLDVVGYVDRWSARAGDRLTFHVSSVAGRYRAQLVRLIHGDDHPNGPGLKEQPIKSSFDGDHAGEVQRIPAGSCVRVDNLPWLRSLSFAAWVWPTWPGAGTQCLFAHGGGAGASGCSLIIDSRGILVLESSASGRCAKVEIAQPLVARDWFFIAVCVGGDSMSLHWRRKDFSPDAPAWRVVADYGAATYGGASSELLMGCSGLEPMGRAARPEQCFNGKISAPLLFDRALSADEVGRISTGDPTMIEHAIARWDFVAGAGSVTVPDRSGNGYHGVTINRPTRLVTGHNFSGRTTEPAAAPDEFNAAYFHDDDLADAGWNPSFDFVVPDELCSGVYAAKLSVGPHCDYVPFVVRSRPGHPPASIAILIPTVSYTCYSNSDLNPSVLPPDLTPLSDATSCAAERGYVRRNQLLSLYGRHSDGSGVSMSSMLRPMPINARPNSRSMLNGAAHQLAADLYITDFLEAKGMAYDVITDHDVHREGATALAAYRTVLSGTHAEYWTGPMLDALDLYQAQGGRFVYLSGNGLYWVTGLSDDGTLVEIRRTHGTRSWTAEPGEGHISLTGELGGLWRHRGRAPQRYVGVGFSAQGFDRGCPYRRRPESEDPRACFIFEGVTEELIGDFPVLTAAHGAAGYEVDRADRSLGTPQHALIVATADTLNDSYQNAIEEAEGMTPFNGGTACPRVRADMVFYETPNDGAVFSVGSIAWCSALSHNGYDNSVARITENVVRAFAAAGPLPRGVKR